MENDKVAVFSTDTHILGGDIDFGASLGIRALNSSDRYGVIKLGDNGDNQYPSISTR